MMNESKHNHCNAPTCGYCQKKPAMWTGSYKKDEHGNSVYRYRELTGIPCCAGCHQYIRLRNGNVIVTGQRSGKPTNYSYYKYKHANYCENIDGRLGQICRGYPPNIMRVLTVDHIRENFHEEDSYKPECLQTLCRNCHAIKDEIVANGDFNGLTRMLTIAYSAKNMIVSENEISQQIEGILKNRFKNKN